MHMGSFISSTGLSFLQTGSAEHIRHWPLSCSPLSDLYARPSRSDHHESVDPLSVLPALLALFGFIFRGRQLLPVSVFGRQPEVAVSKDNGFCRKFAFSRVWVSVSH